MLLVLAVTPKISKCTTPSFSNKSWPSTEVLVSYQRAGAVSLHVFPRLSHVSKKHLATHTCCRGRELVNPHDDELPHAYNTEHKSENRGMNKKGPMVFTKYGANPSRYIQS